MPTTHSVLRTPRPRIGILIIALLLGSYASSCVAAPVLNSISQPGITIGQSVAITLSGSELSNDSLIQVPFPLSIQKITADPKQQKLQVECTVAPEAAAGIYPLRVVTARGISNAKFIAIDTLKHVPLSDEAVTLPIALFGNVNGGERKTITFEGTKGQSIVADLEARKLGSNINPVLRLLDARGRQIAYAAGQPWWGGDARLITTLPHDGTYQIILHDQLYRAGSPNTFRLKLGDLLVTDRAYPTAVAPQTTTKIRLLGGTVQPEQVSEFSASSGMYGWQRLTWPTGLSVSGIQPALLVSDHVEYVEARNEQQPQELAAVPLGVSGIINTAGEVDVYTIPVTPNQKLRVELFARRLGSSFDGVLSIRNEQGQTLVSADDLPDSSDALLDNFTVPANVQKIQIAITDLLKRGQADMNYRITVKPVEATDFSVSVSNDTIAIPAGGTQIYKVEAVRKNFVTPIQLSFTGLPESVQAQGAEIGTEATFALIALSAPKEAVVTSNGALSIVAQGGGLHRVVESTAKENMANMPYLRQQLAWSITEPLPIQVTWKPSGDTLIQGQPLGGKVEIVRSPNTPGKIRLKFITNQPVVMKKVKVKNQDQNVEDAARNLRLHSDNILGSHQTESDVSLFVPGDLPLKTWDAVLAAELLSPDEKRVVATAYSTIARFQVREAFRLELSSPPQAEGLTGNGQAGTFAGKVIRTPGYAQPVVVTLRGLPMGYSAPFKEIPAGEESFELPLQFPFRNKPSELKDIKLVVVADRNEIASAKSNEIAVSVQLKQGEKPQPNKPLEVFEDAESFLAAFKEGAGQATLDTDKFSGKVALRVTPDQKYVADMPNFAIKVREHPGPGEVRYLRYAWRKKGGNTICLQLAHEGQFGPGGEGREGAKFRYHAGPGGEQYGASIGVDEKLPAQYQVVIRDLFADFGEFTLTGFALSPVDGQAAFFDGIYLGQNQEDFELIGK
jgi:hypothetical protein